MISNEALTNAVRSVGFKFHKQTDRMMVWKKRGGTLRVMIRRNTSHTGEYAATVLRQAGMAEVEIAAFLTSGSAIGH